MTLAGAAQVAAAHCPNERTLDSQSEADRHTYAPVSRTHARTVVFIPQMSGNIFSGQIGLPMIATHALTSEGWKAELT